MNIVQSVVALEETRGSLFSLNFYILSFGKCPKLYTLQYMFAMGQWEHVLNSVLMTSTLFLELWDNILHNIPPPYSSTGKMNDSK